MNEEFKKAVEKHFKNRKPPWHEYSRVKCDCGHYPKDHYLRQGFCDKCGCTWYWPNYRYIERKKREDKK